MVERWPRCAGLAAAFAALLASLAPRSAHAQSADAPRTSVRAGRTTVPVRLDGVPDEPVWLTADSVTEFTQRDPEEGAPATERTVVRFLAAERGLYVAFWCYDRTPQRIRRAQLRRDADMDSDDRVAVVLDPQRDRRSGYVFLVNPNGAMMDAEVRGAEDANEDWNGVWDARARVGVGGWTAELYIPWQTLRYRPNEATWGMNVGRVLRHRNEEVLWHAWRRQQGILYLEDEGHLTGLGVLPRRGLAEARPYAVVTGERRARVFHTGELDNVTGLVLPQHDHIVGPSRTDAEVGLDAKLAVAPTVTLDLTANTDFAQVEADRQVVNLTRFPLFFPEKRPFFLEAGGTFDFGQQERLMLFHSRRIGLAPDGTPIPIAAGARLTGRSGRERIGLLAVRTGGGEDVVDAVARVKHDVFSRGYVGGMLTSRSGPGIRGTRLGGGADFEFPLLWHGQNVIPAAFVAWSRDGAGAPTASAWRVLLDYPNDWADNFLSVSRVENGFDPALGFVRQAGVWRYTAALRFFPRPHRLGIRRLSLMPIRVDVGTDLDGRLNNASYEVRPLGATFESGDGFELNLQRFEDVPAGDFEIFPGTMVAAGRYAWNRAEVGFESSPARPLGFEAGLSVGDYYTGTGTAAQLEVTVRAAPHVIANVEVGEERVRLATGRFTARTARVRLDVAATPTLAATLFFQWENESERLTVNARLHWIPSPGSDTYLVWNSAWPTGLDRGIPWTRPLRGVLVGKLVYYFRL